MEHSGLMWWDFGLGLRNLSPPHGMGWGGTCLRFIMENISISESSIIISSSPGMPLELLLDCSMSVFMEVFKVILILLCSIPRRLSSFLRASSLFLKRFNIEYVHISELNLITCCHPSEANQCKEATHNWRSCQPRLQSK